MMAKLDPIHPGEILEEEFMRPLGLSANALAKRIDVPVTRVSEIVRGKRGITADTALRFARLFGTSSELWLGLQSEYDIRVARQESGSSIQARVVPLKKDSRYTNDAVSARSSVGETLAAYGRAARDTSPTRDRRRIRKSRGPRGESKRKFFELVDRLVRSADIAEQKRLKQELARLTYGE